MHGIMHGVHGGLEPTRNGARELMVKYPGILPTRYS